MKTKLTFFLFVAMFNIAAVSSVNASHLAGAEITYYCLGNNNYRIVVTIYRDCIGIPLAIPLLTITSPCTTSSTLVPTPIDTIDLIQYCPTGPATTCHGGTAPGIQRYDFSTIVNLPPCSDWTFSISLSARNAAISDFCATGLNLYVESHLDNSFFDHDSPMMNNDPLFFVCANRRTIIDCSASASFDSLSYRLTCPKTASNTCGCYASGFDSIHFIHSSPPPSLDSITGMLTVNPTTNELGVYAVLIRQFRNGVLIGSITRDVQIYITTCTTATNSLPQISGINGTNQYSTIFPANHNSCFHVFSSDSDSAQTTKLIMEIPLSGATFTTDTSPNQIGTFCWYPLLSDTAACSHCFRIKVFDSNCTQEGAQSFIYCITVVDSGYPLNTNELKPNSVQVFPNPTAGIFTMQYSVKNNSALSVNIYNVFGENVYHLTQGVSAKNVSKEIDLREQANGIYFIEIRNGDFVERMKVLKE